jgi:anti-sigma B factor antagonist
MFSIDVNTAERHDHAVVRLRGELDAADAAGVTAALARVLASHLDIIIDLTDLEFIDCGGLRALAGARDQASRTGGGLLLAAPQQLVLRVLALTGLADAFSIHASLEQAEAVRLRSRDPDAGGRSEPARSCGRPKNRLADAPPAATDRPA